MRLALNIWQKSSTTVKATTPTTLNIIWLRPFSTQLKKLGSNGMPKTPDTLELFKEQTDHSQEAAGNHSILPEHFYHSL
jgi:hypothetical protein